MIKFRAAAGTIREFEVERETKTRVVVPAQNGRDGFTETKTSGLFSWHDTWGEAHAALIAQAARDVDVLRLRLEQAKDSLGQIKVMRYRPPW